MTTKQKAIDLRSDTLTTPNATMRNIMATAEVGDDVFDEDPTVKKLESYVAELTGKESGLFVPTGTMSNLLAAIIYGSRSPWSEIIMGDCCHTFLYEAGNISTVARAHSRQLVTQPDGTLPFEQLKEGIQTFSDPHCTQTKALFLENTHNMRGGKILPMSYLYQCRELCDEHKIAMHCDGARVWNAAIGLGVPLAQVVKPFDTVSVCFSKGLGAPIGSMLLGSKDLIHQAKHARKMVGGGMRQVGIIAAAAMYAVQHQFERLKEDHDMAKQLADGVGALGYPVIAPQTNIVVWDMGSSAKRDGFITKAQENGLLLSTMGNAGLVRAIPHYGNTPRDVEVALDIIAQLRATHKE